MNWLLSVHVMSLSAVALVSGPAVQRDAHICVERKEIFGAAAWRESSIVQTWIG